MTTLLHTQGPVETGSRDTAFKPSINTNSKLQRRDSNTSISSISSISTVTSQSGRSQYAIILVLTSLNNTFEKKSLIVPFFPDVLKLGRQTNAKTVPAPSNGYFDSRVLSRQHAELWAQKSTGKVFIKDVKSSNGTYVNRERLSVENTESEPRELRKNDILDFGIDIAGDDGSTLVHRKIAARVERISIMSLQVGNGNNINGLGKNMKSGSSISYNGSMNGSEPKFVNGTALSYMQSSLENGNQYSNSGYTNGTYLNAKKSDILDASLWGDVDASLEDLIMGHANTSVAGALLKPAVANSASFELTVKRLISEVHSAKLEGAKLKSVAKLLDDIKSEQKKSSILGNISDQLSLRDAYVNELEQQQKQQTALQVEMEELKSKNKTFESIKQEVEKKLSITQDQLESAKHTIEQLSQENNQLKRELATRELPVDSNGTEIQSANDKELLRKSTSSVRQAAAVPIGAAFGVIVIGVAIMVLLRDNIDRVR